MRIRVVAGTRARRRLSLFRRRGASTRRIAPQDLSLSLTGPLGRTAGQARLIAVRSRPAGLRPAVGQEAAKAFRVFGRAVCRRRHSRRRSPVSTPAGSQTRKTPRDRPRSPGHRTARPIPESHRRLGETAIQSCRWEPSNRVRGLECAASIGEDRTRAYPLSRHFVLTDASDRRHQARSYCVARHTATVRMVAHQGPGSLRLHVPRLSGRDADALGDPVRMLVPAQVGGGTTTKVAQRLIVDGQQRLTSLFAVLTGAIRDDQNRSNRSGSESGSVRRTRHSKSPTLLWNATRNTLPTSPSFGQKGSSRRSATSWLGRETATGMRSRTNSRNASTVLGI